MQKPRIFRRSRLRRSGFLCGLALYVLLLLRYVLHNAHKSLLFWCFVCLLIICNMHRLDRPFRSAVFRANKSQFIFCATLDLGCFNSGRRLSCTCTVAYFAGFENICFELQLYSKVTILFVVPISGTRVTMPWHPADESWKHRRTLGIPWWKSAPWEDFRTWGKVLLITLRILEGCSTYRRNMGKFVRQASRASQSHIECHGVPHP